MKKTYKFILPVLLTVTGIFSGIQGVWGLYTETVSVRNHIETGDVNIQIEEYEKNGKTLQKFTNDQTVLPGDVISKIVRVKNLASTCWIRCSVEFGKDKKGRELLSMKNIGGISGKWVKQGNYYYYTEPLEKQTYAEFFTEVHIPESWDSSKAGEKLSIRIRSDAIQQEGFTPDFKALSPWGNQEIQECVHEQENETVSVQKNIKPSVVFSGDAHKLIAAPDDFFGNLPKLMPGSSCHDQVLLQNKGRSDTELFFGTDLDSPTEEQLDLLKHLELTIQYKDKELYHGPLSSEELQDMISLGTFGSGEKGELIFTVNMPAELDNAYAKRTADVIWLFRVESEEDTSGGGGNGSSGYSSNKGYVKTGDDSEIQLYILLLMLSVSCLCLAVFLKRRPENEKQ